MHTISLHLLNYLIPLTLIWMKGLCVSSVLLAHLICNNFRRTRPSPLHASTFLSALKFTHRSMLHGWQFTGWSLAFIFKSLQFIVEAERVLLYLHNQHRVSFVLLAGPLSVSLFHRMPMSSASGALADNLAFWLKRNQSGYQLPPKSHYPPCFTTCQSPPPPTSLFSLTWCCYDIRIWWIQFQTSVNIHTVSIFVLALIFIYKTAIIGFLM